MILIYSGYYYFAPGRAQSIVMTISVCLSVFVYVACGHGSVVWWHCECFVFPVLWNVAVALLAVVPDRLASVKGSMGAWLKWCAVINTAGLQAHGRRDDYYMQAMQPKGLNWPSYIMRLQWIMARYLSAVGSSSKLYTKVSFVNFTFNATVFVLNIDSLNLLQSQWRWLLLSWDECKVL